MTRKFAAAARWIEHRIAAQLLLEGAERSISVQCRVAL